MDKNIHEDRDTELLITDIEECDRELSQIDPSEVDPSLLDARLDIFVDHPLRAGRSPGKYTLFSDKPVGGCPVIQKVYMKYGDPYEVKIGRKVCGTSAEWVKLRNHPMVKPEIDAWQEAVFRELQSESLGKLLQLTESEAPSTALGAVKAVLSLQKTLDKSMEPTKQTKPRKQESSKETPLDITPSDEVREQIEAELRLKLEEERKAKDEADIILKTISRGDTK